jgi:amidohydrolase
MSVRTLFFVPVFLLALAANTRGQTVEEKVGTAVEKLTPAVIEVRHQIHQHPELSNREVQTAALVADRLRTLGLEVRTQIAHTGVVGILRGGHPGAVVALRADMDALPVTEDTPYRFKSTVRTTYGGKEVGVAHACGHDVHTAIMLGVASAFAEMRDELPGTLVFVFQPAEEGPPAGEEGGAALMLKEGVFRDLHPSAIFGLHADADLPVGTIGYTSGATSASNDTFTITLKGKSAHAAWPQLSVDPVVMAAQAVLALQTVRSRTLSPYEPSVITVAQINGGVRNNIIPEEVRLGGTVRLFDSKAQDEVERRMREILDGVARMAGGSYELEYTRQVPVIVSNPELVSTVLPAIERSVGKENVTTVRPWMAADDFAYFAAEAPAFFFHLGTVKPGTKSGNNHTPTFMADDSAIPVGIRVMVHVVLGYLHPAVAQPPPA